MYKIIGIFAIVLVYYCEINAEIDNLREFTTGFPEDVGGPLMKIAIKTDEALNNDLEHVIVERRRAKKINREGETKQNETKESESVKHKKKKKHRNHSVKLKSNDTEMINDEDKKHQKDEKRNRGKSRSGRGKKHKNHKEKDNNNREKSMLRNKNANIENPTTLWYRGMSREREKDHINKKKVPEYKHKHSKKSKQAVDESKDGIKIVKVGAAALLGQTLTSIKDSKTSTSTPKPQSKRVKVGVVDKRIYKRKVSLRAYKDEEKIRSTRIIPLVLNKLNDQGSQADDEGGDHGSEHGGGGGSHGKGGSEQGGGGGGHGGGGGGYEEGGSPTKMSDKGKKNKEKNYPSHLSPYALVGQMEQLMKEFPNANATVTKFARTVEYNDIILVTVSDKKGNERYARAKDSKYIDDAPEKKIIFIVHGLTVMGMKSMTSLIQMTELKLLFSYYFKHLDKFDFYIMPLANPDGYSASRSSDRTIWNKNVSPQSVCPGVFVDRNFDVAWNATRDISSCSQLYPGASPFSEVESKAVRDVFHYYSHKILAYIHVHPGTFDEKVFKGDAILYPRGYTEMQSDDDKYIDLKGEVDEAMKNASFRVISVTVDTLANWYGVVAGSSVDYAAAVFGIPYALEFVMQIYDTVSLNNDALTQIWSRLIDTTFNNMWKSLHRASEERKTH